MYECVRCNTIIVIILITIVNRIGGVIVSDITPSTLYPVKPNNIKLYLLLLHSIKKKEHRLIVSESG